VVEAWKSYDKTAETFVPFAKVLPFAVPIGLVLAIVGSYLLARSALSPVGAIVRAARAIGERDLSQRLPVERPRDELGQLASTFNDLLARLEIAFHQREETLAQQRRFVADASHELRTPLTSIQGYARMLRQWALDDPATARESIAVIEREAARMGMLVESLLSLARGDEGAPLECAEHDLREVACAAVEAARAAAQGKVGVVYRQPDAPVVAAFDGDRIRQVATILLDNAVKYTPEGGTVTVALRDDGCAVELSVADTGVGIPAEHLPHLFERFYRVDAARSAGGIGLGLAIARQIAEHHGGTIEVSSEVGVGARFALRLPVDENGKALTPAAAAATPLPTFGRGAKEGTSQ
jgi:signal transduction histidine kinase